MTAVATMPLTAAPSAQRNKWVIAAAVTFGTLMGTIDTSIVNVAMPQLRGTLSATVQEITWVSTGYVVASVIVMPITAWLGSRFGRKKIYLAGLLLFLLGSLLCGTARSLAPLVVFRIMQGLGAGALQPTEQAILRETFPPHEQGMAMGLYAFAIMIGPMIGPTLGGYIVDNYSWPWIFYINMPVGVLGLFMVWRFVEDPPYLVRSKGSVDWWGLGLLVLGLAALQTLLEQGEQDDWFESNKNVALACVGVVSIVMFVLYELYVEEPIVNLRVLSNRSFSTGTFIGAILGMVLFSTLFLLPVYMQEFLRYNAMQTGLALMPRSITMLITIPIVGALYNKLSPRLVIAAGLTLGGITCIMMSHFTLQTSKEQILVPQVIQGVALALIFIPLSTVSLATMDKRRMGQATGLNNLVRQLGGSFGVAIFAAFLERYMQESKAALVAHVSATDPAVQQRLFAMRAGLMRDGVDMPTATARALQVLDLQVGGQAAALGFEKAFYMAGLLFFCAIPFVALLDNPDLSKKLDPEHAAVEI